MPISRLDPTPAGDRDDAARCDQRGAGLAGLGARPFPPRSGRATIAFMADDLRPDAPTNALEAFFMPFTANRRFKANPRLLARAEGMHYYTQDGRQVLAY